MAFPGSSLPPDGKARSCALALRHQFKNLVTARCEQILSQLSIRQKIGYGYALVIGLVVLGTGTGLIIGKYYQYQATQKLAQVQEAEYTLSRLQIAVLETKNNQQELIFQLHNPEKFDKKEFEYQSLRLFNHLDDTENYFLKINSSKSIFFQDSAAETAEFEKWQRTYEQTPGAYRQQLEAILKSTHFRDVDRQAIPALEALLLDFKSSEVAIQFEGFAHKLTHLIELSSQEEKKAVIALANIGKLQIKVISASMLLSIAIAWVIASYTNRVTALPFKTTPKVPLRVTEDTQFDLPAHLTTQEPASFASAPAEPLVMDESLQYLQLNETPADSNEVGKIAGMGGILIDINEHKWVEEELRQSEARFRELARREALLNQLGSQIRRSLDLNTILETAVQEIRNLLQIDRCLFLWYRPDAIVPMWEVVQESKTSAFRSIIGHRIRDTELGPLTARVLDKQITRVDNARALKDRVEQRFFFSLGYTALLALPIHTKSGEIGVVSCGHSSGPRPWRDSEVKLLQAVADQIAIAIDQAELYKQSHIAAQTAQEQATQLEQALHELQHTQAQLIQSEKMSSLGQLVAGITHEINNPINFIYGNLTHFNQYAEDLLKLVQLYQEYYPNPEETILNSAAEIEIDFIKEDLPKVLSSMKSGIDRVSQIMLSLRNFSRLDEAEMKWVDIHEGLDNTLLILSHRLKAPLFAKEGEYSGIQVFRDYGNLPQVLCYAGQLNQVFMNILTNAIEAIDEYTKEQSVEKMRNPRGTILISTEVLKNNQVVILISDNGIGMTQEVSHRLFDPFFTTKPVGSGTGLGLSISYQIVVEKHGGQLQCVSAPGQGAAFLIQISKQPPMNNLLESFS